MPTLSQLTGETRTIFKLLGIAFGAILLIFLLIGIKNFLFPPPPPLPTVSFGKLPPLDFPASSKNLAFTYKVDTVTNSLPKLISQEKVFKMEDEKADLLALSRANDRVRQVGFSQKGTKISENVYQWKDTDTGRTLTMNIANSNFNMISNFLANPNNPIFVGNANTAISSAKNFLQGLGLNKEDFDDSKTQVGLYSIKNFSIVPSTSLSNTQAIKVNFFQKNFNGNPIFYPQTTISPMSLLVGNVKGEAQVVEATFFYQKPSDASSTYPLKTSQQAFDDLKNGKGYIASYNGSNQNISITKVYLGYYISEKKQDFLIPIVVFEGNDSFVSFVSAIRDEWVSK